MGIRTISDYVNFFIDLDMGESSSLISFVNNEKQVLKHKLQNNEIKKEIILEGIKILEELSLEIREKGEIKIQNLSFKTLCRIKSRVSYLI